MACATQVFDNITPQRFTCLAQKAAASGINLNGNQGQASHSGVTIRWNYDPVGQTLELKCLAHPFLVSDGTVNHRIHDLVDSCP
jgi:hypothetical protein